MESQPWGQRAVPSRSWAARPLAGSELSSRFHDKSCLSCLGVYPGGPRCIWGMAPGQTVAWPPGPRTRGAHSHWPSSSSLCGSPCVCPGLEVGGTIHHHPSFTRKGDEDGQKQVSSVRLLLQRGDYVQRPLIGVPVVDGGQLSFGEAELILICFYLLFPNFCAPPPLPEKKIFKSQQKPVA